jgi:phosphoglucosamine mutase
MPRQLFGTDGIRGVAGEPPLDPKTVAAFGASLGEWAAETARSHNLSRPRVVIGMDTRESGPWLAEYVAAGLSGFGVQACFAGLTTTPGVAYLTRTEDFVAGVMISASHNPYRDNGLKVFAHNGFKLDDAAEHRLEERIFSFLGSSEPTQPPALEVDPAYDMHYVDFLASTFKDSFAGRTIVLDCANGAACRIGPGLFQALGARVIPVACSPDGRNINLNCGALHVESLRERVVAEKADFGAAFDGDADRCILISHSGKIIDGDHCLYIAARHAQLKAVVATQMSNLGLERALAGIGARLIRTAVGDRYVLEEMLRSDLPLGGEQSGHVIFRKFATTGDGMLTALQILQIALDSGATLDELTADLRIYPQILVNVRFKVKRPLEELPAVQQEINATNEEFGDSGRILVRFSGTEPLARVMVEGPTDERVEFRARRIAKAIETELS